MLINVVIFMRCALLVQGAHYLGTIVREVLALFGDKSAMPGRNQRFETDSMRNTFLAPPLRREVRDNRVTLRKETNGRLPNKDSSDRSIERSTTMSQTTANDLLSNLGLTHVKVEQTETSAAATPAPRRKNVIVALLALVVLGTGTKLIGDYAAERAIDAWATRQQAQFSVVSPEVTEIFNRMQAEGANEVETAETAQDAAADSVSLGR